MNSIDGYSADSQIAGNLRVGIQQLQNVYQWALVKKMRMSLYFEYIGSVGRMVGLRLSTKSTNGCKRENIYCREIKN